MWAVHKGHYFDDFGREREANVVSTGPDKIEVVKVPVAEHNLGFVAQF